MSLNQLLLDALRALDKTEEDEIPEGFLTVKQWAKETGKSTKWVQESMSRLAVCVGGAEMKRFRIKQERGVRPVPHWRLLP